jgi:choline dehydrogenase
MPIDADVFDYVIVGAGTAGCVLANRLAADGRHTVCVLEAGPPDHSIFLRIPAGVYKASDSHKYAWQFETEPHPGSVNRRIHLPQGKTLGGSTAINGMVYNRGCPDDFDAWEHAGNRGWSYADVLPYFKRSERRIGQRNACFRGTEGALSITDPDWLHPLCDAFIEAARSLGIPRNPDYNAVSQRGVGYYQRYIENGWRISAARAFLQPVARMSNVDIRTHAHATAVLFDRRRATGVRYAARSRSDIRAVMARREVILSAGAANTPKLLQISGVGPVTLLAKLGIAPVLDLPCVGSNLQDHFMTHFVVRAGLKTLNGRGVALFGEAAKWILGQPSILANSPSLAYGFINARSRKLHQPVRRALPHAEARLLPASPSQPRLRLRALSGPL